MTFINKTNAAHISKNISFFLFLLHINNSTFPSNTNSRTVSYMTIKHAPSPCSCIESIKSSSSLFSSLLFSRRKSMTMGSNTRQNTNRSRLGPSIISGSSNFFHASLGKCCRTVRWWCFRRSALYCCR